MAARSAAAGWAPDRWARPSAARPLPRQRISYFCANGHETGPTFAVDAADPRHLGLPALRPAGRPGPTNPPPPPKTEPYKTHLAYVKERRSDAEAAEILDEALQTLRAKRKCGEIIY